MNLRKIFLSTNACINVKKRRLNRIFDNTLGNCRVLNLTRKP